jgi:hypothetical protein
VLRFAFWCLTLLGSSDWFGFSKDDHVVAAGFGDVCYVVALFTLATGEELVSFSDGLACSARQTGEFLVDGCAGLDERGSCFDAIHEGVVSH